MHMRRAPRYVEVRSLQDTLLLIATGAVAGVAAGAWLGRRYGSLGALVDDVKLRLSDAREFWSADDELETGDETDEELAAYREAHGLPDEEEYEEEYEEEGDDEHDDEHDDDLHVVEATAAESTDALPAPREARAADLPSNRPDERTIEAQVLDRFEEDELLRQRAVDIAAVGDGVIELSGWVHSGEEAARAAALARAVQGVSMVLNRIVIRGPGVIDDAGMAHDVAPRTREGPESRP
jgi:hypothetical protein